MNQPPTHIPPPYYEEEDEVTLKDIILKAQDFGKELIKYAKWILLAVVLMAGIFFIKSFFGETTYTTALTFLVNEEVVAPANLGYTELGNIPTNYDLKKLVVLARSSSIIHQVLLKTIIINDKKDYIGNHLIAIYEYNGYWEDDPDLEGFYFKNDLISDFSDKEYKVLNSLQDLVIGNNLTGTKGLATITYDKTGIVNLGVTSRNNTLSNALLEAIFEELSTFYTEQTVGRLQRTYDLLAQREEQVKKDLNIASTDLETELDNSYTLSLNNAIEHLSKLLENVTVEKEIAIKIAQKEKEIAQSEKELIVEKTNRELAIAEEEKKLAIENAQEEIKILEAEKELIIVKNNKNLEIINAENKFILDELSQKLAITNIEKELANIKTIKAEQLVSRSRASKRERKRMAEDKFSLKIADFKEDLSMEILGLSEETLDMSWLIDQIKDSLFIDEQLVKETIANYEKAQEVFKKKKLLNLEYKKEELQQFEKEKNQELDSTRNILSLYQAEQLSDSSSAILSLDNINQGITINNTQEQLAIELERGEYLRTKRIDYALDEKSRKVENIDALYANIQQNKQSLEFVLKNKTPEFQIIDQTFIPLVNAPSKLIALIIGAFLGLFLSLGGIIFRKVIRDALAE